MAVITDKDKIEDVLTRGLFEVIDKENLRKRMSSGEQLRIKLGIDPTGSDLHIGHAVVLRKLRQFQDLGHIAILLIGDYTAMVGDPTGKNETRPILAEDQVKEYEKTYIDQAAKILDMNTLEIRHNSEWFGKPGVNSLLMELTSKITVARILERDDFQKRIKEGSDIQMQEILYPLLQGYDSVALEADVELGGTDQKFNLLMGRKMQKKYNQVEQDVITTPLLVGTDGVKKMSKTYNNFISLFDTPEEMFGKTMSIPDDLILSYFELATDVLTVDIAKYESMLKSDANPRDIKLELASALTFVYHGDAGVKKGKNHFSKVIQGSGVPDELEEVAPSTYDIVTLLIESGFCKSKSDARRTIEAGGVKINDTKIEDTEAAVVAGDVVQKGKRFFVRVA